MSIEETEKECAANATAPRVSLESIGHRIRGRYFTTVDRAFECYGYPILSSMTLCCLEMSNDFLVIGKSAPASPENFDKALGEKLAYEDAIRQVWPLEGYLLKNKLKGF